MLRRRLPPRSPTVCEWAAVCDTWACTRSWGSRRDYPQRLVCNTHLDRRTAQELSIGINIERIFRFQSQARRLEVLHLRDAQVKSKINGGEKTKQIEFIHVMNDANVESSV